MNVLATSMCWLILLALKSMSIASERVVISEKSMASCADLLSNQLDSYRADMVSAARKGFANAAALESTRSLHANVPAIRRVAQRIRF
jgi:hypothetical protein